MTHSYIQSHSYIQTALLKLYKRVCRVFLPINRARFFRVATLKVIFDQDCTYLIRFLLKVSVDITSLCGYLPLYHGLLYLMDCWVFVNRIQSDRSLD